MSELARSDASAFAEWRRTVDWPSLTACAVLIGIGLLLSLAAGPAAAERYGYSNPFHFPIRHTVFVVASGLGIILCSTLPERWARRLGVTVFIGAFLGLVLVVFDGHTVGGATRWLLIAGQTVQPSEFAKPGLVVLVAWLLSQRDIYRDVPWNWIALGVYGATIALLFLQPDFGMSVLMTAGFVTVFFVSGLSLRWAAGLVGGGTLVASLVYLTIPYVRGRVNSIFNPEEADTYQIDLAIAAIERGGLWGVGAGEGRIKSTLPDAHSDFIYAVAVEEFGFIAALVIVGLIGFLTLRGLSLAAQTETGFQRAAASGLFALFGLQAAINIGVNMKMLPPTGMTLPFVSYGGTSMLGTALTLGLGLALVRRHRVKQYRWRPSYGAV